MALLQHHPNTLPLGPTPYMSSYIVNPSSSPTSSSLTTHRLVVRQQPIRARVALGKEKDRKPIDPPPILQLEVSEAKDPNQHYLQSPYYFVFATLVGPTDEQPPKDLPSTPMVGSLASSLHKLKDASNHDGGFFVFPDLSIKVEGKFRLLFTLFEFNPHDLEDCVSVTSVTSEVFQVFTSKNFPGMAESTFLTRSFSDQGVRLRLRKDSRAISTRKRNRKLEELTEEHYKRQRYRTSSLPQEAPQMTTHAHAPAMQYYSSHHPYDSTQYPPDPYR